MVMTSVSINLLAWNISCKDVQFKPLTLFSTSRHLFHLGERMDELEIVQLNALFLSSKNFQDSSKSRARGVIV